MRSALKRRYAPGGIVETWLRRLAKLPLRDQHHRADRSAAALLNGMRDPRAGGLAGMARREPAAAAG